MNSFQLNTSSIINLPCILIRKIRVAANGIARFLPWRINRRVKTYFSKCSTESANSRLSYQVPVSFVEYYSDIEFLVIYLVPIIPAFMNHDARHHRACTNIYLFILFDFDFDLCSFS